MKYAVVIERTRTGYSAYVPDLPGCVAASKTAMGVRKLMREAIEFHLEGMKEDGIAPPKPTATTTVIDAKSATKAKPRLSPKLPLKPRATNKVRVA